MPSPLPLEQAHIDTLRAQSVGQQGHVINGRRVAASNDALMDVVSPIDGQVFTHIANGTASDMDQAIANARTAFDDGRWSRMPPASHKAVLYRLATLIEAETLSLSVLGVRDNGTEISMAFKAEAGSAAGTFRYYAEAIDKCYGQIAPTADSVLGLMHHEPVGVVHVNTYDGADNTVPLGGVGQSGNGHDKSLHALSKYTNLKTAWMQL